jgi:hypothetical protein
MGGPRPIIFCRRAITKTVWVTFVIHNSWQSRLATRVRDVRVFDGSAVHEQRSVPGWL